MLTVDENGWLKADAPGDPEIRIVPSRRNYYLLEPPCDGDSEIIEHPLAWVWHTTDLALPMGELARRIADATRKGTSSWNAGIARDGVIWQSVAFTLGSWHVGNGGSVAGRRVNNVNRVAGGIELESPGRVIRDAGVRYHAYYHHPYYGDDPATGKPSSAMGVSQKYRLPDLDPYGQPYEMVRLPAASPYSGGYWPKFTDAQVAGAEALVRAVVARWPALASASLWRYGHVNYPGRTGKEDPGPLWPPVRDAMLARAGLK